MDEIISILIAITLATIGALHVAWATGNPWPFRSMNDLIRKVFSDDKKVPIAPPPFLTLLVALGLFAAAYGALALIMPALRIQPLPDWLYFWGMYAFAGVMLLRGILEPIVYLFKYASPEYQKLDRLIYAPLCIVLGVLILVIAS